VLIGALADAGFESFAETEAGLEAYIQVDNFNELELKNIIDSYKSIGRIDYRTETIPAQNWNAVWESDFQPIEVSDTCRVRAPFHPAKNVTFELIIQPKMSFGTGHHETTFLMLQQMLNLDFRGKDVLDMGSGTAVLALLASKMQASRVVAIDIDQWCYENALENAGINQAVDIAVEKGDVTAIGDRTFHVILANINKNVLMQDIQAYSDHLHPEGLLLISGFYKADVPDLVRAAASAGFVLQLQQEKNQWTMLQFKKTDHDVSK
jgi:ribosomal protein L11 methyltransferase